MKIRRYFCFFLIIILAFSATETVCAAPADSGAAAGSYGLHGSVALVEDPEMLKTTQAAIAYELNTDTLLFAKDPDKRINPTGLVKLLTALIVLEEADLNEMATVYRNTLDTIALGLQNHEFLKALVDNDRLDLLFRYTERSFHRLDSAKKIFTEDMAPAERDSIIAHLSMSMVASQITWSRNGQKESPQDLMRYLKRYTQVVTALLEET